MKKNWPSSGAESVTQPMSGNLWSGWRGGDADVEESLGEWGEDDDSDNLEIVVSEDDDEDDEDEDDEMADFIVDDVAEGEEL
jgi:hypothetical protein